MTAAKCARCKSKPPDGCKLSGEPFKTCSKCREWSRRTQQDLRAMARRARAENAEVAS